MVFDFQTVGIVIAFLWLSILSIVVWIQFSRYGKIFKGARDQSLTSLLSTLIKEHELGKNDRTMLLKRVSHLEEEALSHIQRVGLIRFNPFQDTGGAQSFILALVDAQDSGIVLSGLYARSGMRWYVKKISKGKGVEHDLSEEEKKAIEMAK